MLAGGVGFIGSHILVELLKQQYDVVIVDNYSNSTHETLNCVKKIAERDFTFYECDISDGLKLDEIFYKHKVDCIIHLASFKSASESVASPLEYYKNNINTTISLCEAMKRHDIKKLVFSSAAGIYSPQNTMPITEDAIVGDCVNPYGWSKFMSEQILCDATIANPGWSVAILRFSNIIGAHESGEIGENLIDGPKNMLTFISQVADGTRDFLEIFGDDYPTPDGSCIRDYTHVVDLAKGHIAAIKYCNNNTGVEIFNLGTGKGTSSLELVAAFENVNNIKIPVKISKRRTGDVSVLYYSTEKAKKMLNWSTEKSIIDGCRDMWRWQSKNLKDYR